MALGGVNSRCIRVGLSAPCSATWRAGKPEGLRAFGGTVWGAYKPLLSLAAAALLTAFMISPVLSLVDQVERWIIFTAFLKSHLVARNSPKARTGLLPSLCWGSHRAPL